MSREMIDVVQRACAAWGSGELGVLHDLYTPDVVADGGAFWFESERLVRGVDAVVERFEALINAFERNELIPEKALALGDTLVVALLWRGLPANSSTFLEQRLVGSFTFRHGRIAAMIWFPHLEEALKVLDLPRSAAEQMVSLEPDQSPVDNDR